MKIRGSLDYSEHKMVSTGSQPGLLGFFSSKGKTRGKLHLMLNGAGGLMKSTWKMPRYLVVISPHFLLVIPAIRNCRALRLEGKSEPWKAYHWWVRTKLRNLKQTCTSPWNLIPRYWGHWPVSLWGHFQLSLKGQGELACLCGLEKSKWCHHLQQEKGGRAGELQVSLLSLGWW